MCGQPSRKRYWHGEASLAAAAQPMPQHSGRRAKSLEHLEQTLARRLQAWGRVHEILERNGWRFSDSAQFINDVLEPSAYVAHISICCEASR
jgi:hypothetical protein